MATSQYTSVADAIDKLQYYLRLVTFEQEPLKEGLLHVFHNKDGDQSYIGLPENPKALYHEFSTTHLQTLQRLKRQNVIDKAQYELILPPNSNETHSEKFDLTLLVILIAECTTLPAPATGWKRIPPQTDFCKGAFVIRGREWRNGINHPEDIKNMKEPEFEQRWGDGCDIIQGLGYTTYNTNELKKAALDQRLPLILQTLRDYVANLGKDLDSQQKRVSGLEYEVNQLVVDQTQHNQSLANLIRKQMEGQQMVTNLERDLAAMRDEQTRLATDVENEVINQIELIKQVQNTKSRIASMNDDDDYCLEEVRRMIIENLGDQLDDFLTRLDLANTNKDDAMFAIKNIPWTQLKRTIERIGKTALVEEIQRTTLVTEGISSASGRVRKQLLDQVIQCLVHQRISISGSTSSSVLKKEVYVDLKILQSEVHEELTNSDREVLLRQHHLLREGIEMKDLLCKDDDIVVVRGCAGCGKTSLVEMFARKWAEGGLETKIPINYIFIFSCREINTYLDEIDTVEDLLKKKYPEIFNSINVDDLRPVADRILIILDGVDELKNMYEMADGKNTQSNKYLQTLYNLIDSNGTFLKGHKSIIAGRPKAAEFIKSKLILNNDVKTVEVCGFSPENVDKYIGNFFGGSNRTKAQKVREAIAESDNLKVMASVPVFLWIICNIFSDDLIDKPLISNTELYFYTLLVFMRNHLRSSSTGNHHAYRDLYAIVNDDSILNAISLLMSLSTKTYMQNKVIFEESDIPEYLNLEETGFITKYSRGINQKPAYQFTHLVIQEFLCSLNLCIKKSTSSYASNRELSSCLPTILGIQHMLKSDHNDLFKVFYEKLEQEHLGKLNLSRKMSRKVKEIKFNRLISRTKLPSLMLRDNVLVIDTRKSECREFLDLLFEAKFNVDCLRVDCAEIHSYLTPTDIRNACFLLQKVGIRKINHRTLVKVEDMGRVTLSMTLITDLKYSIDFLYAVKDSMFPLEYTKSIKEVVVPYDSLPVLVEWLSEQREKSLLKFLEVTGLPKVTIPEYADLYFSNSMAAALKPYRRVEVDFYVNSFAFVHRIDRLLKELNITVLLAPRKMISKKCYFHYGNFDGLIRLIDVGNYTLEYPHGVKKAVHRSHSFKN